MEEFHAEKLRRELRFKAVRSSGKGGQHVNKVSTSVELYFNVESSVLLSIPQKEIIKNKLNNRISKNGELIIVSQTERSQLANKKLVIDRFYFLIEKALRKPKQRIASKISENKKKQRLEEKSKHSEKKILRKKDWLQ